MRGVSTLVAAVGVLAACTEAAAVKRATSIAPSSTSAKNSSAISVTSIKIVPTTLPSVKSTTSVKPTSTKASGAQSTACAAVSATLGSDNTGHTAIKPSDALACLQSVPLDVKRSSAFCDYIEPFLQFQSTLAYLKNPPIGYTLPGVDILGGLAEIQNNVETGKYESQWDFETDLWALVNILPHDFHVNLPMPLLSVFNFQTVHGSIVSVSTDGLSLPKIYFKNDLDQAFLFDGLNWTPSPLVSVNGVDVADYINFVAQTTSPFQDPDAIFNQALTSLAFSTSGQGDIFQSGAYKYGFADDSYDYTFANGTTRTFQNIATTSIDFTDIKTGNDLFDAVDLPPEVPTTSAAASITPAPTSTTPATTTATLATTTSLVGYPSPVVIHPDGYTSGYFIPNTTIAVLAMQGFVDPAESDQDAGLRQQVAVRNFLAAARKAGMTKLIIDLQTNGGGLVFNGFDAFKQLFPALDIFGASRIRATPEVNYLGTIFSAAGVYNDSFQTIYQTQASLDLYDHPFASWNVEDPPAMIHGDNFTQELRTNFSDPVQVNSGGINITGYLSNANAAPQLFKSEDMVLLYDGSCGSTCAIFSELMKAQGGVRSIAVGGRPQYGPMQGVAGSKGAQVYTYGIIAQLMGFVPDALAILKSKNVTPPALPPSYYIPDANNDYPLGKPDTMSQDSRFNLRNNMHDGDATQTPLQFVYEAANCKLFYTFDDQYEILGLWERVAEVAWGKGKCVKGSSVMKDDSFPKGAYDTVPFGKGAYSTVQQPYTPGLLEQRCDV